MGFAASRHDPTISSDLIKTAPLKTILLEPPGWGLLLEDTTQLYLDLKIHSPTKNHTVRTAWVRFAASRHGPTIS